MVDNAVQTTFIRLEPSECRESARIDQLSLRKNQTSFHSDDEEFANGVYGNSFVNELEKKYCDGGHNNG